MLIEYKRWVELLKLTPQDNNWKHLHIRFQTDNSYYREMKDYIDHVLNEFVEDDDDYKHVKESVDRNANVWKTFCESASVNFVKQWLNDPLMRPSKYDIKQFQLLFIRPTKQDTFRTLPLEADWEVLDMMADLHKRNVDNGLSLDKAFGLEDPVGHPPKNPFEVPDFIRRMVVDMIDNDETQTQAIANEMSNLKTLTHSVDHYKHMMLKYKWTALNDHLHDRFLKGRKTLDERERKRIHKNWDGIYMPEILVISSDFVLYSKSTIKAKETQVIKSSSNLH